MTENNRSNEVKKLTMAAVCFALCMVLPFLVGNNPPLAMAFSPMHIPVLIAGFAVGPFYAAIVGFFAPLVRHMIFGVPMVLYPVAIGMAFELATYGIVSGVLYRLLPKKVVSIYISLIVAMFVGRIVFILANVVMLGLSGRGFSWQELFGAAFVTALPGIVLHIVIVPIIVIALKRAGLLLNEGTFRFRKTDKAGA